MATSPMITMENPSKDPHLPGWYTIGNLDKIQWISGLTALGNFLKKRNSKDQVVMDFVRHVDWIKKKEESVFRLRGLLENHHRHLNKAVNSKQEGKVMSGQTCRITCPLPDSYEAISKHDEAIKFIEAAVNFTRRYQHQLVSSTKTKQEEIQLILEFCSDFKREVYEQHRQLESSCMDLYDQLQRLRTYGQGRSIYGTGAVSGNNSMQYSNPNIPAGAHETRPMNSQSQHSSGSTSGSEPNDPLLNPKNTKQGPDDANTPFAVSSGSIYSGSTSGREPNDPLLHPKNTKQGPDDAYITRVTIEKTVRTIGDNTSESFKEQEQFGDHSPSHPPDHNFATGSELHPTHHCASPSPLSTQQDCSSQSPKVTRKSPEDNNGTRPVDLGGSIKDKNSESLQKPSGLTGDDRKDDGRHAKDFMELSSQYSDFKRDIGRIVDKDIRDDVSDEKVIQMVDAVIEHHKLDLKNSRDEAELLRYAMSVLKENYCREFRLDGKLEDRDVVPLVCQALKQRNDTIQKLESDGNRYKSYAQKFQSELQTLKEKSVRDKDELTYLRNEVQRYKTSIDETTHSLKTEKEKRRLIEKEKNELTERFSRFMHDKISLNDSSTENINMPNRPSQITESYKELITGPWMDVIETVNGPDASSLQSSMDSNEIDAMEAVSDIMMLCWKTAKEVLEKYKSDRRSLLCEPVVAVFPDKRKEEDMEVQASGDTYSSLGMDKPVAAPRKASVAGGKAEPAEKVEDDAKYFDNQLLAGLLNNLKLHAGNINIDPMVEAVKCKALEDEKIRCMMTKETMARHDVHDFIDKCCRICWKMAIQQPPMSLSVDGLNEPMDKEKQELYYDCRRQKNSVVLFYVKPALIHDTKVMQQGMVYIGVKK